MQVWVNGRNYVVDSAYTIFQFCANKGINLPCFCYHEKLAIAGNCRMCLVEVLGSPNLVISCAMPILDKMKIITANFRISKGRENILEFLLANHPLDCPICDQAGECDLQDLALSFGSDFGRYTDYYKRSVTNLNFAGPLIKTVMTRCIHCTRCVRFVNDLCGISSLGVIGRGNTMEIGTYQDVFILDELIGNIIDLCPVGALTSMPYSFQARPWELKHIATIDILDALGSSVRLDIRGNTVMRVLPQLNESLNGEWITNKTRFFLWFSLDAALIVS